ncbi:VOC family protein [Nocardia abscessus]|uniref:VOC family protein n=1 Tax=Nocardia TaxID=1817 RepID=UPI0018956ADD|nr:MULTISPECIES: VOC family protein [Nocardia]MBF6221468.1 VOC family protein [Nocardia abscessus]MDE1671658.1 VOC family protein [Nocardia gipuzkoensis]
MIAGGPIFQLCWVVEDLGAACERFTTRYGVGDWFTIPDVHFGPSAAELRGAPADYTISVALGYAGGQQLELIEPRGGVSLYAEHLDRLGPGLHHTAWVPADYDAALAEAAAAGIEVVARGRFEGVGMEFAYLDGGPIGSHIELMRLSREMKAMFDHLIPEGFTNPWQ